MNAERLDRTRSNELDPIWATASVHALQQGGTQGAPIVHEDDREIVHRLVDMPRKVTGISRARLELDHRTIKARESSRRSYALNFKYVADQPEDNPLLADLFFGSEDFRTFSLSHREVLPGMRRKSIGSDLLHDAEQWFAALAAARGEPLLLKIPAAQIGVIHWALQNGYEVEPWDKSLLERIQNHPEQFDIHDVERPDTGVGEQYIFPKNMRDQNIKTAIRLNMTKTIEASKEG
ncbi:MAG: hypothetical protein HYS26_03365 [Candidatus Kaiserbacteria bacterium]|nr:MAG: hypothetical protein HYS26_03365 [Candidatus Kaiserbacteria bacterium]